MIYKYNKKQEKIIQYLLFTCIKKYCKNRQDLQVIINISHNRHHLMRILKSLIHGIISKDFPHFNVPHFNLSPISSFC